MNRAIFWLSTLRLRQILTVLLVGITVLVMQVFGDGNQLQAQAEPLTPEATQYQVNSNESPFRENDREKVNQLFKENKNPQTASETIDQIGENLSKPAKTAKQNLEDVADSVREKSRDTYNEQENKPTDDVNDVAETIKEKLNLDQPIYPGTKKFLNDVQDKVEEVIPGTKQ